MVAQQIAAQAASSPFATTSTHLFNHDERFLCLLVAKMPGITAACIQANHSHSRRSVSTRLVVAGQILWLPPKEDLIIDVGLEELEDGCYNHPVVVLSSELSDGKVIILTLTSFNGVDLSIKHARNIIARLGHLPIKPCPPHPDNDILLSLEGDVFLNRNSYIKTEKQHTISFSILRSYDSSGRSFILTKDSYQELIKYIKFIPITSPAANIIPGGPDRSLRRPHLVSQSAADLPGPGPNDRFNENPRLHFLDDEERQLYRGGFYRTIQNAPYTQHHTNISYGSFTDNSRALTDWNARANLLSNNSRHPQYSRPDPWPSPRPDGDDDEQIGPRILLINFFLWAIIFGASYGVYWVTVHGIGVVKEVARSAWGWIRGVSSGI